MFYSQSFKNNILDDVKIGMLFAMFLLVMSLASILGGCGNISESANETKGLEKAYQNENSVSAEVRFEHDHIKLLWAEGFGLSNG